MDWTFPTLRAPAGQATTSPPPAESDEASRLLARDFLYADPESYRAGVLAALAAVAAVANSAAEPPRLTAGPVSARAAV